MNPQVFPPELYNFFAITFDTVNLFSIMIGMMFGLSSSIFLRYRAWLVVVAYFAVVAIFYAYFEDIQRVTKIQFPEKYTCNLTVTKEIANAINYSKLTEADKQRLRDNIQAQYSK